MLTKSSILNLLILSLLFVSVRSAKKKSQKLKLFIPKNFDDILVFIYKPNLASDSIERFNEIATTFGFQTPKELDCLPNGKDCRGKLLSSIEKLENVAILLLNSDYSLLNIQKSYMLHLLSERDETFIISDLGPDGDRLGVQFVSGVETLRNFLQDDPSDKSLLEMVRGLTDTTMSKYSMIYDNQINNNVRHFFKIDGESIGITLHGRYGEKGKGNLFTSSFNKLSVLVQFDLANPVSAAILDQSVNFHLNSPQRRNEMKKLKDSEFPTVLLAIIIDRTSLFVEEFFDLISSLQYPKSQIDVFISCQNKRKTEMVKKIIEKWEENENYRSITLEKDFKDAISSKEKIVNVAKTETKSEFVFFVRSTAQLDSPEVLTELVKCSKNVVTPLLRTYDRIKHVRIIRSGDPKWGGAVDKDQNVFTASQIAGNVTGLSDKFKSGTNYVTLSEHSKFWDKLDPSILNEDEESIKNLIAEFENSIKAAKNSDSLWRVRAIKDCYLVKTDALSNDIWTTDVSPNYTSKLDNDASENDKLDMAFSNAMLLKGFSLHLLNHKIYGQIVNTKDVPEDKVHPELSRYFENHELWERRYITETIRETESYSPQTNPNVLPSKTVKKGKCPDTFEIPLFTPQFGDDLIEECENSKLWSNPKESQKFDERYGRRESVPAHDIGLSQLDLEEMWMSAINFYILPRKISVFPSQERGDRGGHFFIIRYRPDDQPDLRPHDDNSLYTMNVALNRPGIDFEGGGTKFLRYDCAVPELPIGNVLLHPGRLTHFHEGLATTKGSRYVLISFVNSNNYYSCYMHRGLTYCPGWKKSEDAPEPINE